MKEQLIEGITGMTEVFCDQPVVRTLTEIAENERLAAARTRAQRFLRSAMMDEQGRMINASLENRQREEAQKKIDDRKRWPQRHT